MNCLIDYIGLTGCGDSTPASGLFINSLPGISLKSIEQLADAEQKTYIGVWNDVQLRATKRLQLSLNAALSKEHKLKTGQYSTKTHYKEQGTNIVTVEHPAILIKSDCYSELQSHYIQDISVRCPAGFLEIQFLDADSGLAIHPSINVENFGSPTVETVYPINLSFTNQNILIKVIHDFANFYEDTIDPVYFDGGSIQFGTSPSGNSTEFNQTNKNYGISLTYGLRCSLDNIACSSKDLFALPLWYFLGSELMMERMTSERINKWTVDRKQAEELKAFYDNEAEKALAQAIAGTNINDCDCCIQCDPPIAVREARL